MQQSSPLPANAPSDKARILIVDDRPEKILALEAVLEDLGQTIVHAHSGREALRHVLQHDYAVILLDVNMPGMDGFETAELIRQRPSSKHLPIIFVTAFNDEMHAARGYSLGAVDYIQAPVLPDVLRTKVAAFVDLYLKTNQLRQQAESLRGHAVRLQKLAAASLAINSALSTDRMLQTIADAARDVIGTRQAIVLHLGDAAYPKTTPVAVGSFDDLYTDWQHRPLELGAIARTSIARSRSATRLTDTQLHTHPDWPVLSNAVIPPLVNGLLAAPLYGRQGDALGVIYVTDPLRGVFADDDEAMLVQLAQMGSIAIENTLYSQEREANRAKDEFLATLSHELRTPLNAILGWTELMKDQPMGEEIGHAFGVIDRSARAQAKLIEDLLEVSRINSGKLQISPRSILLHGVIEAAVDAIRPSVQARNIRLEYDATVLPELHGDPDRLQQVAWNLLSNAIKFTPDGGRVSVRAATDAATGFVTVSVSDSGQGIAADFLPHVFERFRQADSSSTRRHGGLGIGLTIVRHIVELHGGHVSVQSEGIGRGATFLFSLPTTPAADASTGLPANAAAGEAASGDAVSLQGLSVLLVEDDADARDMLATLLRRFGATVTTADSVRQALAHLDDRTPDLIISDISMPEEDGYSFMRKVVDRFAPAQPPHAIAVTANAAAADSQRALDAGYREHVAKPVTPAVLLEAIKRVLAIDASPTGSN